MAAAVAVTVPMLERAGAAQDSADAGTAAAAQGPAAVLLTPRQRRRSQSASLPLYTGDDGNTPTPASKREVTTGPSRWDKAVARVVRAVFDHQDGGEVRCAGQHSEG
eukprot:COSAG01_NODE_12780_length_1687_cov_1.004408_2_plen_107_part_00